MRVLLSITQHVFAGGSARALARRPLSGSAPGRALNSRPIPRLLATLNRAGERPAPPPSNDTHQPRERSYSQTLLCRIEAPDRELAPRESPSFVAVELGEFTRQVGQNSSVVLRVGFGLAFELTPLIRGGDAARVNSLEHGMPMASSPTQSEPVKGLPSRSVRSMSSDRRRRTRSRSSWASAMLTARSVISSRPAIRRASLVRSLLTKTLRSSHQPWQSTRACPQLSQMRAAAR